MRTLFFVVILFLINGCQYAVSPWETNLDCPHIWVPTNLARIAELEAQQGAKDHFKVAILGDPQMWPGDLQTTLEILNKREDVDFLFLLGDLVEIGIKQEYEWICKALSHSDKPVVSVIGNHDSLSYGREIWRENIGPYDFSFEYQGTKFIAYNDNKYEFENVPDRDWLATEADGFSTRNHTIGASHIAPWENDLGLSAYLKSVGFDHMIHAHLHRFDYWQITDVGLPHYIVADIKEINFAIMTVYPDSVEIENCTPGCVPAVMRTK